MDEKQIKKKVAAVKKKLKADFKKARDKLAKSEKEVGRYIEQNPKKAVAVAAGLGAALAAGIAATMIKHKKKR